MSYVLCGDGKSTQDSVGLNVTTPGMDIATLGSLWHLERDLRYNLGACYDLRKDAEGRPEGC